MTSPVSFSDLGLSDSLCSVVSGLGYTTPTPVQAACIPPLLEGRDLIGLAATGTGKTAAFALPMVTRLEPGENKPGQVQGLVLAPTRELALQVSEAIKKYGSGRKLSVLTVYGGSDIGAQMKSLRRGVDVVVATPGRALDHIRRKSLDLSRVKMVVLDEADEMLDLGFAEDLEAILSELPAKRQTALFSATLAPRIATLGEKHLNDPVRIRLERPKGDDASKPRIEQIGYVVTFPQKAVALKRVLELVQPESAIIFCRTREDVEGLGQTLERNGHSVATLHGGLSQEQRDRVMRRFKQKQVSLLVATDVAARGLDVDHVTHVVNVDLPHTPDTYVHRIGRTGRAGRTGTAISFVLPKERFLVTRLEQATQGKVNLRPVPAMEELRAHRVTQLEAVVNEALGKKKSLDSARAVVAKLVTENAIEDIAAAALVALSQALHPVSPDDEIEIPAHGPAKKDGKFGAKERPARFEERPPRQDARAPRFEARAPREATPRASSPRTPRASSPRAGRDESAATPRASAPRAARSSAPRAERPSRFGAERPERPARFDAKAERPSRFGAERPERPARFDAKAEQGPR
ncbi:MAG: DEAD/DEAH box helicase, partial [Myxococcus sp.]|nr:DEAD/DEAH box helicase [Myxococcus sp.]